MKYRGKIDKRRCFCLHSQAREILLVSLLAASAPAAASVTQFAQIYRKDYELASSINVCTVIFCIITMPLIIMLYQMITSLQLL